MPSEALSSSATTTEAEASVLPLPVPATATTVTPIPAATAAAVCENEEEDDDDDEPPPRWTSFGNNGGAGSTTAGFSCQLVAALDDASGTTTAPSGEKKNVSRRQAAADAAQEYLDAFDPPSSSTTISRKQKQQQKQQGGGNKKKKGGRSFRIGMGGHKERILGAQFSHCGRYLATAGQDSSVRIWNASDQTCLATLREGRFSQEYECLRVSWSPLHWGCSSSKKHKSSKSKCLYNYLLATSGADGVVKVFGCDDPSSSSSKNWKCLTTIDHSTLFQQHHEGEDRNNDEEDDRPQSYALQFIKHWDYHYDDPYYGNRNNSSNNYSVLLTSSDDHIHIWEIVVGEDEETKNSDDDDDDEEEEVTKKPPQLLQLREAMSLRFGDQNQYGHGVTVCHVTTGQFNFHPEEQQIMAAGPPSAFGGERNPNNLIFVFDASYCPANGLLGVALSDGSLRLVNGRGVCLTVLALPGIESTHLTSFCWDDTGTRLATCLATGHIVTWTMRRLQNAAPYYYHYYGEHVLECVCTAVLQGGHEPGRPLFGCQYCSGGGDDGGGGSDHQDLFLSWGVDGRLCLWDSYSEGEIEAPIAILVQRPDYPIYAVDHTTASSNNSTIAATAETNENKKCIALAGGGAEGGFLGVPVYFYDL